MENLGDHSSWQCSVGIRNLIYYSVKDMVHPSNPLRSVKVKERRQKKILTTSKPLSPNTAGLSREGASLSKVIDSLKLSSSQQSACTSIQRQGGREVVLMIILFYWANNSQPAISRE